jgi:hypothetical protein
MVSFGNADANSAKEQPAMNNQTTEVLILPQSFYRRLGIFSL